MTRDAIKINWFAQTFRLNWRFVLLQPRRPVSSVVADVAAVVLLLDVVMLPVRSLNVTSV